MRQFLNCGYALLVEMFQGMNVDLLAAVDRVDEVFYLKDPEEESEVPTAAQNDRALKELSAQMAGLGG